MAKHPIDHLFEKKLKNLEKQPGSQVWERLEGFLEDDEKSVRVVGRKKTIWRIVAASVVLLLLGFSFWNTFLPSAEEQMAKQEAGINKEQEERKKENQKYFVEQKERNQKTKDKSLIQEVPSSNEELEIQNQDIGGRLAETNENIKYQKVEKSMASTNNSFKEKTEKKEDANLDERPENPFLMKENKENLANVEKKKKILKIVVTVKLSGKTLQKNKEHQLALQVSKKKRGVGKILKNLKELKNGEGKVLNIDTEKLLASIGKKK